MTKFPHHEDDKRLVDFLRQNRPDPPSAAPDLEQQIMRSLAYSPDAPAQRRLLWIVPPAIAASLIFALAGSHFLTPRTAQVDTGTLEAFLENNWNSVVDDSPEEDWMPIN